MMTTVTTTTATVVSTATAISGSAIDVFATLGIIGTAFLIGLLITKELLGSCENPRFRAKAANLDIVALPMLFVFAVIVYAKIMAVL